MKIIGTRELDVFLKVMTICIVFFNKYWRCTEVINFKLIITGYRFDIIRREKIISPYFLSIDIEQRPNGNGLENLSSWIF